MENERPKSIDGKSDHVTLDYFPAYVSGGFAIHPAAQKTDDLLKSCRISFGRRGGPGGQHRNKVETAVVITHGPTLLRAEASEKRSQAENRKVALFRLRVKLAIRVRLPVAEGQCPSSLWSERVRSRRIQVNSSHKDFPSLLAEALDFIVAWKFDVVAAAERLSVSTSQLVRLLRLSPAALEFVNRERIAQELPPLH